MYYLKKVGPTIAHIQSSKDKIGSVMASKQQPGKFVTKVGEHMLYASTMSDAFHEMVALLNRVSLCGENDAAKAKAELERRNAEVYKQAAEINALLNGAGWVRVKKSRVRI